MQQDAKIWNSLKPRWRPTNNKKSRRRLKLGQMKRYRFENWCVRRKCASKHNGMSNANVECQNMKCQTYSDQTPDECRLLSDRKRRLLDTLLWCATPRPTATATRGYWLAWEAARCTLQCKKRMTINDFNSSFKSTDLKRFCRFMPIVLDAIS